MRYFWTRYLLGYPKVLLYMLQDTEYKLGRYAAWYHRTTDFRNVMKRRTLTMTRKVQLLLLVLRVIALVLLAGFVLSVALAVTLFDVWWALAALVIALGAPFVMAYGIIIPLFIGWLFIQKPREKMMVAKARQIFAEHPAIKIAIAGSYGKTTAKEMLRTVLAEGMDVAATPGNMNTAIGISRFARTLRGDEKVLIVELGEERDGDVAKLARIVTPDYGVITGINEAHLASFKSLGKTIRTIMALGDFVDAERLYANTESELVHKNQPKAFGYSKKGVAGWAVTKAETSVDGTSFTMKKKAATIHARTKLVGLHTVGVTAMAATLAESLGMNTADIEAGLTKVTPFEHRMEPKPLHGAWVIDDTYNGNSEGVEAGLHFLKSVAAQRRIYVTPGLVEQGDQTESVHKAIGAQAAVSADMVVLMTNSVTEYIKAGLTAAHFKGILLEFDEPLEFYENLDQFIAAGDVVLMQNDWTDNYQ